MASAGAPNDVTTPLGTPSPPITRMRRFSASTTKVESPGTGTRRTARLYSPGPFPFRPIGRDVPASRSTSASRCSLASRTMTRPSLSSRTPAMSDIGSDQRAIARAASRRSGTSRSWPCTGRALGMRATSDAAHGMSDFPVTRRRERTPDVAQRSAAATEPLRTRMMGFMDRSRTEQRRDRLSVVRSRCQRARRRGWAGRQGRRGTALARGVGVGSAAPRQSLTVPPASAPCPGSRHSNDIVQDQVGHDP